MSNHTPTTEQVEYGFAHDSEDEYHDPVGYPANVRMRRRDFQRWLAQVKAEAQVYALRETSDALAGAEPQHLGYASEGLEFFDYGTGAEYGIDVAAAYLRNVANRIARAAGIATEGNKTGESND